MPSENVPYDYHMSFFIIILCDITPYPLCIYVGPYCSVTRDVLTIMELCDV